MSKQVLISLLKQGNTGAEILNILDAIVANQSVSAEPTLEQIDF